MKLRHAAVLLGLTMFDVPRAVAHAGHSHPAPRDACTGHALGDPCSWKDAADARHVGTCRGIGGGLMCIRNKPIVRSATESGGSHTPIGNRRRKNKT